MYLLDCWKLKAMLTVLHEQSASRAYVIVDDRMTQLIGFSLTEEYRSLLKESKEEGSAELWLSYSGSSFFLGCLRPACGFVTIHRTIYWLPRGVLQHPLEGYNLYIICTDPGHGYLPGFLL